MGFVTGNMYFMNLPFLELTPKYLCQNAQGEPEYECGPAIFCTNKQITWRIDWDADDSIHNWITDLNLYCKRLLLIRFSPLNTPLNISLNISHLGATKTDIGLIGTMYLVGWAVSAFILPRSGDKFGRKPIYLLSMTGQLVVWIGIIFSRNLTLTTALNFFFGFFQCGRSTVGFVFMLEFVPRKYQAAVSTIAWSFVAVAIMFSGFYFLVISDNWIWLQVIGASMTLIVVICLIFIPESPKYLVTKKKYDQARANLQTIAKVNGKTDVSFDFKFDKEVFDARTKMTSVANTKLMNTEYKEQRMTGSLKDLIKVRRHYLNLIILALLWMLTTFNEFLLTFQSKYFKGNKFINSISSAACNIPVIFLSGIFYQKIGIKATFCMAYVVSLIGGICLISFQSHTSAIPLMVIAARLGTTMSQNLNSIVPVQVFPPIFVGTALGICHIVAKVISISSAMLAELEQPTPMIIFAVCAFIGGCVSLLFIIKKKEPQQQQQQLQYVDLPQKVRKEIILSTISH